MPTIPLSLRYLLLFLLFLAILSGSFYLGWHEKGLRVDSKVTQLEAEMKKAEATFIASSATLQLNQLAATQKSEKDHATAISSLHTYYTNLLRERTKNSRGGAVSSISSGPRTINEIPSNALPLAYQCAETTQQLESLQAWIRSQQNLSPPPP